MIVSCYTMQLYCRNRKEDGFDERHWNKEAELTGTSFADCKRQAIKRGWVFHRDYDVTCPACAAEKRARP